MQPVTGMISAALVRDSRMEVAMAHTHEFDCIVCGAHFDSQRELVRHNEQQHMKKASGMEKPRTEADADRARSEQEELGHS